VSSFKTIGIIGHLGMVGNTTFRYFKDHNFKVYGYDLKEPQHKHQVFNADLIFVCVPTPFDWTTKKYDNSIVNKVFSQIPTEKIVVLKSTVTIGTTDELQKKHSRLKILFNPEFLSEASCDYDFRNPDRQYVGYTDKSLNVAKRVLQCLPKAPYEIALPAKEAELLKFIHNLHGVIQVMISNHFYEVCQKEGLNYQRVINSATAAKWFCDQYRIVQHKGYRGAGGKCFPKDLNTWIEYCQQKNIDATLMRATRRMNKRILKEQKLTERKVEKM
jgi:UDPglucose 6-dehydrogenase